MTIDDLKNVRRQKQRVESLQERIERLRSRAEYTQQQLGECGRSDPMRDRLAEYVAQLDELEQELTGEMIVLEKQVQIVSKKILSLTGIQEMIIRSRFIEGFTWGIIARKTNYSIRQCRRLYDKALYFLSR